MQAGCQRSFSGQGDVNEVDRSKEHCWGVWSRASWKDVPIPHWWSGEAVETFSLHRGVVRPPLMAAVPAEAAWSVLVTAGSLCQGTSIRAHQRCLEPAAGSA